MTFLCISIIGPDTNPIYIGRFCDENIHKELDFYLFCSLDYFDNSSNELNVVYKLHEYDNYQTWGCTCFLDYKIIVVSQLSLKTDAVIMEEAQKICDRVRSILKDALMDPFYKPFSEIKSRKIRERLEKSKNS